jgi:acetolactate synthase-1/2/3 large subunit
MDTGQIIAQTIKLYDVEYLFGFTGGDQRLWLGLRDAGIKYILPHTERSAGAMADAYSRLTGKPSFMYGQWGPGAALCVPAVAEAYWGKSPVVCITSGTDAGSLYRYAYQGIDDQQGLFAPVTKWNARVPSITRVPDILRTAIRRAVGGVPGPVQIDIPRELTRTKKIDLPDVELYAESECKKFPAYRVAPVPQDIERVMEVIAQAQRPLILAGGGIIISEAWDELVRFAEQLSIPVVTSAAGKSAIATTHPLAVGVTGNYSRKVANDVVAKCDSYIVIGSNLGDMTTKGYQVPNLTTKVIHIDLDSGVLGTNFKEEVSVTSDAKLALKAMLEAAEGSGLSKKAIRWADWVGEVQARVASWKTAFRELAKNGGSPGATNPYFIMSALNKVIRHEDVIVADTGYMGAYGAALIDVKASGRKYIRAAGSLGWGFPAALGAQFAIKDNGRVICITGDGGIGYHAIDIETAVRWGLPVVVVVMNNASLAFEYHIQKILHKDIVPEANDYLGIDYAAVARACGAYGEKVREAKDVEGALRRGLDVGKPAIIDFSIDKEMYAPVVSYEQFIERQV